MNDGEANTIKLSELLRHPDDLDKISGLKADFTRKKAAVDAQLKLGLKEQLQLTQNGMDSINDGQKITNAIKEEMIKIDRLCAEAQIMIRNFPEINAVAQAHRNFTAVEKMKNDIENFQDNLDDLNRLIKEDDEQLETQPNLLAIHYGLTQLRNVRDDAMEQIQKADDRSLEDTLLECFKGLEDTIDDFNEHVGMIMGGMIPLVQEGKEGLVVRLAIVIEEEEKFDNRVKELRRAQQEFTDLASRFKSLATGPKELRGYKDLFLQSIKLHAQDQLEETETAFNEDADRLEKSLKWYFNELNTVKLGMTNLMPKKWKIFQTYTQIYHELLCKWITDKAADKETTPTHMLAIIHWKEKYYDKMKRLGVPIKDLEPELPGGRDSDLVREYRQLIIDKVEQWVAQINKSDRQAFRERRESDLDHDENNHFRTKTLADLWLMLREQLIVASSSNLYDVIEGVTDAMFRALKTRQDMWTSLLTSELDRYARSGETEGMQGLQDWLIAIANDQILCIEEPEEGEIPTSSATTQGYLFSFCQDYESLVSPDYIQSAAAKVETTKDGLTDLMLLSISVFSRLIFLVDFRNIMTEFFTPTWYSDSQLMRQVISTYEDYLGDYKPRMPALVQDLLIQDLAKQLLIAYLQCVRNKNAKFRRQDPFVERLRDDIVTVFHFFEKEAPSSFNEIKAQWRVLEGLMGLLECEKHVIHAEFEKFIDVYWDVRMSWVEAVLKTRDDVEFGPLGDGKSILKGLRATAAERRGAKGEEEETIMSQVD